MTDRLYLDYNATAPIHPDVIQGMACAMAAPGNASSVHADGRAARKWIEDARTEIAALTGSAPRQIIFNSGATEGNNTILRAYAGSRILVGAGEHASVYETGAALGAAKIPLKADGTTDLDALADLCKSGPAPALISIMMVNNETGIINPVREAARIAHEHSAAFHVDAVQAAGKIPLSVADIDADFMTISAHKFGGPQGVGALITSDGSKTCFPIPVLLTGGGQERSCRAGTENVAGIAGFGIAAGRAHRTLGEYASRHGALQQYLEEELRRSSPRVTIYGTSAPRIANTTCFSVKGASAETMLMNLDLAGVSLSSGSACSSGKVKASHVLIAMGVTEDDARGALRVSTGWNTTQNDIEKLLDIWHSMVKRIG